MMETKVLSTLNIENNYRYERKFTAGLLNKSQVINVIKNHPGFFKDVYYERQINNIYFDTSNLQFYHDNVMGNASRRKIRIRWYGDDLKKLENPVLEIKSKEGLVGDKWSYSMHSCHINDLLNMQRLKVVVSKSDIPPAFRESLLALRPTLFNWYSRRYFQTFDSNFRLTVDSNLSYNRITNTLSPLTKRAYKENHIVVELKYGLLMDTKVSEISSKFPFRLDKSSKYVSGIDLG